MFIEEELKFMKQGGIIHKDNKYFAFDKNRLVTKDNIDDIWRDIDDLVRY